ncbi:MAG: GIY-YIG nuclease family protein [Mycobacterium sp.]
MPRRKQVYKVTYPNGKIYVGMDLTGSLLYFGSPSAHEQIAADLGLDPHRLDITLRKEILWECETATDAEVRAKEMELIRETRANDPAIGYNKLPRWVEARKGENGIK